MKIILAPMEGVVDYAMRELLTASGHYDLCITEFVRVVDQVYRPHYFYKICPELRPELHSELHPELHPELRPDLEPPLHQRGKTRSGVPVRIQLLGQNPEKMAANAAIATDLGSQGIDLNFGCPAKTVNKHRGGAVLLQEPETLYKIVKQVRGAVPSALPVSAKMRLGYKNTALAFECAQAIKEAGANMLTIHARTKIEGYRPPAHWHIIDEIRRKINIPNTQGAIWPIIANGDIWTRADAIKCREVSGCSGIMIGRGALSLPNLASVIRHDAPPMTWQKACALLCHYAAFDRDDQTRGFLPNRIKQWFNYLKQHYPEAPILFEKIKKLHTIEDIVAAITLRK